MQQATFIYLAKLWFLNKFDTAKDKMQKIALKPKLKLHINQDNFVQKIGIKNVPQ
jgi:hypothetical protein